MWSEPQPQGGKQDRARPQEEPSTSLSTMCDSPVPFFSPLLSQTLLLNCCLGKVFDIQMGFGASFLSSVCRHRAGNSFKPFQFIFSSLFAMKTAKIFFNGIFFESGDSALVVLLGRQAPHRADACLSPHRDVSLQPGGTWST